MSVSQIENQPPGDTHQDSERGSLSYSGIKIRKIQRKLRKEHSTESKLCENSVGSQTKCPESGNAMKNS